MTNRTEFSLVRGDAVEERFVLVNCSSTASQAREIDPSSFVCDTCRTILDDTHLEPAAAQHRAQRAREPRGVHADGHDERRVRGPPLAAGREAEELEHLYVEMTRHIRIGCLNN